MSPDRARRQPSLDPFLSEEDLDLRDVSWEESLAWWDHWLREAQAWNERDEDESSHGVFAIPRREWPDRRRSPAAP